MNQAYQSKSLAQMESERYYRSLLNHLQEQVVVINRDYKITDVNKIYLTTMGREQQEVIGRHCYEISHGFREPCPNNDEECLLLEVFETGLSQTCLHQHQHKDGSIVWADITLSPLKDRDGNVVQVIESIRDITAHKKADAKILANLHHFKSMHRISEIIGQTMDVDEMLKDVIGAIREIFDSDRAWLLYPCDPEAPSFRALYESNKPDYPGGFELDIEMPMNPVLAGMMRTIAASKGPVTFSPETKNIPDDESHLHKRFLIQSQLVITLRPKIGKPWILGMHQCSYAREWTRDEQRLFSDIASKMSDALNNMLLL